MNIFNPLYAIAVTVAAVFSMSVFSLFAKQRLIAGRFSTIDGLRGYLALFVFIHHSSIWFVFNKTGIWELPRSNLFAMFGQASVSLFFMITSFLFFDKLLIKRKDKFDWYGFFMGRLFRLFPLYLIAMCVLFAIVAVLSHGELRESSTAILKSALRWMTFSGLGAPDINHVEANIITAGVTWSLPYEWCFYLVLPLIWVLVGGRLSIPFLAVSCMSIGWVLYRAMSLQICTNFLGGMVAALVIRDERCIRFAKSKTASILAVALVASLPMFPTAYDFAPFLLLTLLFCLIASGTSIFGILHAKVSHGLGELAYSIYLLHGIVLFVVINFAIGSVRAYSMSTVTYTGLIVCIVPILLGISILTFKYIEAPGIAVGKLVLEHVLRGVVHQGGGQLQAYLRFRR